MPARGGRCEGGLDHDGQAHGGVIDVPVETSGFSRFRREHFTEIPLPRSVFLSGDRCFGGLFRLPNQRLSASRGARWDSQVIMYECLVGYTPFYADDPVMTCRKILRWQQVSVASKLLHLNLHLLRTSPWLVLPLAAERCGQIPCTVLKRPAQSGRSQAEAQLCRGLRSRDPGDNR